MNNDSIRHEQMRHELDDRELERVAGGFNPQPEPPARFQPISRQTTQIQERGFQSPLRLWR